MSEYDVVIVGGGMVGATLACALGDSELQIALLEHKQPQAITPADEIDLRVSAISCASQRILAAVGAWPEIAAARVSPYREMRVWDAGGFGSIHFDSAALGEPLLGWIIENRLIQTALLQRAEAFANVELLCPAILQKVQSCNDRIELELQDGRSCLTKLLVGADGADSKVRRLTELPGGGWSYHQKAVVTTVATELPHQETAWQRFLPTGPLAFLPLHDGRCSIVWSTLPEHARELLELDENAFAEALAKSFEHRLGTITAIGRRGAFPLQLQYARDYVKPRIALIGDAAHVVHPLAGQGVNLGLLDAAALTEVLIAAVAAGQDIGSFRVLRRYERWRKGDNLLMMSALDGFKRLFCSTSISISLVRNLGLQITDAVMPIKNRIARHAMGLVGDLPKLARSGSLVE